MKGNDTYRLNLYGYNKDFSGLIFGFYHYKKVIIRGKLEFDSGVCVIFFNDRKLYKNEFELFCKLVEDFHFDITSKLKAKIYYTDEVLYNQYLQRYCHRYHKVFKPKFIKK